MFDRRFHGLIFIQDCKTHFVLTIPNALLGLTYVFMSDARSCKRSETLFKSLLFWLAGEVSCLAVEVLFPCQK